MAIASEGYILQGWVIFFSAFPGQLYPGGDNNKGEVVIEPQYDDILMLELNEGVTMGFKDGYAPVKVKDKWGFINVKGEFIVELKYDKVDFFRDNRAAVYIYDEKAYWAGFYEPYYYTYIRPDGTEITDFIYRDGYHNNWFKDGAAIVDYDNRQRKLIDRNGNILLDESYTFHTLYENGFIGATWTENGKKVNGYISPDGKTKIRLSDNILPMYGFREDRAVIKKDFSKTYIYDFKYGMIDTNGKVIVEPIYELFFPFSEGYAAVKDSNNLRWGFIDKNGNYLVEPKFKSISEFNEGMAAVCLDDKFGFINSKGEMVIEPAYDAADYFYEGYARVNIGTTWWYRDNRRISTIGGKWGFIDKKGNLVIDTVYDYVDPFYKGIARVFVFQYGRDISEAKIGYIDKKGNWIWEPTK